MKSLFENITQNLEEAVQIADINKSKVKSLKKPKRFLSESLKIKTASGKTKTFQAYRVQYNNKLGPFKGGIRFHPISLGCRRLHQAVLLIILKRLAGRVDIIRNRQHVANRIINIV